MKFQFYLISILLVPALLFTECRNHGENKKDVVKQSPGVITGKPSGEIVSLHKAALDGDLSLVERLLDNGFKVDSVDEDGRTPLIYAAYNGHTNVIKKLIQKGAFVNFTDQQGRTPLMMAASGPFPEAVKLLLDNQADPDMRDKNDRFTAIMFAAYEGQLDVVRILLASNADPFLKDKDGNNALTFAEKNNHMEVATVLKSFRDKSGKK